jgi:hypothetical protein
MRKGRAITLGPAPFSRDSHCHHNAMNKSWPFNGSLRRLQWHYAEGQRGAFRPACVTRPSRRSQRICSRTSLNLHTSRRTHQQMSATVAYVTACDRISSLYGGSSYRCSSYVTSSGSMGLLFNALANCAQMAHGTDLGPWPPVRLLLFSLDRPGKVSSPEPP